MSDVEQWEHDEQRAMENEIERLRGIAVESRSSVRLDLENYERVLDDMNRSDQQRTAAYEAVSKERTRLFRLLAKIDALAPPNVEVSGDGKPRLTASAAPEGSA